MAGRWRLVATSNTFDQPWIFDLVGRSRHPVARGCTGPRGRMLVVPGQSWDSGPGCRAWTSSTPTRCSCATPRRAADGYYYITYSGSDELTQFGGWGHAEIGIARSTDLVHWRCRAEPGLRAPTTTHDGPHRRARRVARPDPPFEERVGLDAVPLVDAFEHVVHEPVRGPVRARTRPGAARPRPRPPWPGRGRPRCRSRRAAGRGETSAPRSTCSSRPSMPGRTCEPHMFHGILCDSAHDEK